MKVAERTWVRRCAMCCIALPAICAMAQQSQRAIRALADPASGTRWLLAADPTHPGGPGRLVLEQAGGEVQQGETPIEAPVPQVIRAGDRLLVVESYARVEACFEAVALEPARQGAVFTARFAVGGARVRVVALGSGRAALAPALVHIGGQP